MGLVKNSGKKIYLNVKNAKVTKSYKEDGTWKHIEYEAIEGHIVDFDIVDKTDATSKLPYKELQVQIIDDEYYVLTCRLFRPFSDGLLLSLGNTDLSLAHRISPYKGKKREGSALQAPTYCSVRVRGEDTPVRWIDDGVPKVKYEDNGDGTVSAKRKERNEYLINLIEKLKESVKDTKQEFLEELAKNLDKSDEPLEGSEEDDDSVDSEEELE